MKKQVKMNNSIEKELGVVSTYTVQLRNNTYNALSEKNIDLIKRIKDLGHHIGLHQNPPVMDLDKLKTYVSTDIQMLEYYYGFYVDCRSTCYTCRIK